MSKGVNQLPIVAEISAEQLPKGGGTVGVNQVVNSDGTLTISPTVGNIVASLNLAHSNTWTVAQSISTTDLGSGSGTGQLILNQTANTTTSGSALELQLAGVQAAVVSANTSNFTTPANYPALSAYFYGSTTSTNGSYFGSIVAAPVIFFTGGVPGTNEAARFLGANGTGSLARNLGLGVTNPTALLHIKAGTATAGSAPLKFNSGTLNTTAEAGAVEFLTDKGYLTITTGAARKELTLNDAALTSTRVPFATTNGRLVDSANLVYASATANMTNSLSQNAGTLYFAGNANAGGAAYCGFTAITSAGHSFSLLKLGTGYTTAGPLVATDGLLYTDEGKVIIATAASADVVVLSGGLGSTNERLRASAAGNVSIGNAAIATNATDGFLYLPSCAGPPTGTPTAVTGRIPCVVDSTNNKMYIYSGGNWVILN